jgi:hypothetical protein
MTFCPEIPDGHPRIIEVQEEDYSGDGGGFLLQTTACWRAYQGTWEIRNDRFYLVAVRGRYRLVADEPVFADWFTGVIRVPKGEMLQYVHMGFGSVFEQEVHTKIEKGHVVASRVVDNRGKPHDEWELGWKRKLPRQADHS